MLVHICCSVDSHFFLKKLKDDYPQEKLIGFFYDPNIHPYSEYKLRYIDVKRSCSKLGIELLEGEYDIEKWFNLVKGYEAEPEKGDRCTICYDDRLEVSVKKAKDLGERTMTSTLLVSPKKSQEKLIKIGSNFKSNYGVDFIFKDYRAKGGSTEQNLLAKKDKLYRQDYCGCIFALKEQREFQNILTDELFNPISKQCLPSSIEERLDIYENRIELEKQNKTYEILKNRFLNYREFNCIVRLDKKVINAKALFYSLIKNKKTSGRIEKNLNSVYYLNRSEVKFISLDFFNISLNTSYKSVKELLYANLDLKKEISLRDKIGLSPYDLSAVFVLDEINEDKKYDIFLDSRIYEDIRENLVVF